MAAPRVVRRVSRPLLADAHPAFLPCLYTTTTTTTTTTNTTANTTTISRYHAPSHDRVASDNTVARTRPSTPPGARPHVSDEQVAQQIQAIKERWSSPGANLRQPPRQQQREQHRESASRREGRQRPSNRIPFEGIVGVARREESQFDGTTMTPRELRVFEELFRKGVTTQSGESKKEFVTRAQHVFPELLRPLAEEAEHLRRRAAVQDAAERDRQRAHAPAFDIEDRQSKETRELMDRAQTDMELYRVLDEQLFEPFRHAGENGPMTSARPTALPVLLQHYLSLIHRHFPGSPLALALLPQLRKLGPSAFALGASTTLYNQHMRMLWQRYTDVDGIVQVLAEMDHEVYAFDHETHRLLDHILHHAVKARRGDLGPALHAVWSTDRKARALEKLTRWHDTLEARSRAEAVRERAARQAARTMGRTMMTTTNGRMTCDP